MIGGVTVDQHGRTTLPGLWAAGEATSSGLHGANRLASNSLLEGLVYGARAAEDIAESLPEPARPRLNVQPIVSRHLAHHQETLDLADIRQSLRTLMWFNAGISRNQEGLTQAAKEIDLWRRYVLNHAFSDPTGWTLQNMLTVARLMVASAAERKESRGVHYRSDFPEPDPAQQQPIAMTRPPIAEEDERDPKPLWEPPRYA